MPTYNFVSRWDNYRDALNLQTKYENGLGKSLKQRHCPRFVTPAQTLRHRRLRAGPRRVTAKHVVHCQAWASGRGSQRCATARGGTTSEMGSSGAKARKPVGKNKVIAKLYCRVRVLYLNEKPLLSQNEIKSLYSKSLFNLIELIVIS